MTLPIFDGIIHFITGMTAGGVIVALIRPKDKRIDEYRKQASEYFDLWRVEVKARMLGDTYRRDLTDCIRALAIKAGIVPEPTVTAKNKLDAALKNAGYTNCNYDHDTGQWSYRRTHINPQDIANASSQKQP